MAGRGGGTSGGQSEVTRNGNVFSRQAGNGEGEWQQCTGRKVKRRKVKYGFLDTLIKRANGEKVSDLESSDDDVRSVDDQSMQSATKDDSGLNPNRIRGFGSLNGEFNASKVETPSLNQMHAKQGAIVAKFMTFFKRKSTLVIEMYEACFYKNKPKWDQIAEFVYKDLCPTEDLRKAVVDVQLHPVKMLIFIRFSEDKYRDLVVSRVRSHDGIIWSDYKVKVKGYSLDAKVKFIRLLGASPETQGDEIVKVFKDVGIGEVIELKKGLLDSARLPGVTNGTWSLRVKIADADKSIPSYIHRRDEGELWSLNFEGRVFCCWKCGSSMHIGDKCREQNKTFEETFGGTGEGSEGYMNSTWAAVVRSGNGDTEGHKMKVREMEMRVMAENKRKAKAVENAEKQRKLQLEADAAQKAREQAQRQNALKEAEAAARCVAEAALEEKRDSLEDDLSDEDLLQNINMETDSLSLNSTPTNHDAVHAGLRAKKVVRQHIEWMQERKGSLKDAPPEPFKLNLVPNLPPELDLLFGRGAKRLAIEYLKETGDQSEDVSVEAVHCAGTSSWDV